MPVRSRSRASIAATMSRPPLAIAHSSSSSAETPGFTKPPSLTAAGASARSVAIRRSASSRPRSPPSWPRSASAISGDDGAGAAPISDDSAARSASASAGSCASERPSTARSRGVATPELRAPDQALEVGDLAQQLARAVARGVAGDQPLDRVLAAADARDVDQREQQPAAQQAAAHRRAGLVDHVEQRALALALEHASRSARGGRAPARRCTR